MQKNGDIEDELQKLDVTLQTLGEGMEDLGKDLEKTGSEMQELGEKLSHWKKWRRYYAGGAMTVVGKASAALVTYIVMGLTMSHYTGEDRRVENFEEVVFGVGALVSAISLDNISYFMKADDSILRGIVHFGRCTDNKIIYISEDDNETTPFIHFVYDWETWFWKVPKPRSFEWV